MEVAHVDHGWREESGCEADGLCKEVSALGLPFHSVRLPSASFRNREAAAREERMGYFTMLFAAKKYQALLLGHQADDLAETALKRLLEGAHLSCLGGMQGVASWGGISIWRPLLFVRRKTILSFLQQKGLPFLVDPTNCDPAYLRSRMRKTILPELARAFGKEIVDNLTLLAERAYELQRYLDRQVASCRIERGPWGIAAHCGGLEKIEQRHLLQKVAKEEGMVLPRTVLEPVLHWLEGKGRGQKVFFQSKWFCVQGKWVFFLPSDGRKALPEKGRVRTLVISFSANHSCPIQ